MGYLGKISAIVTANTGDFSRNLNAAASDVRKFAGAVQNNITKASTDAERAFKSIYTPLQTLERSLKAAASMKLSFKGFDGAIRDINVLKERLTSIKGTQVDLILKASGLKTISEFRDAIKDISNESFNFAVKFGGIDKLKLIREELRSVSSTSINAVLSAGGLERLKELKETVAGLKDNQLNLALRVGGTETLTKVEQQATGLTKKDMNLLVKVGGAEALDRVVEEVSAVDKRTIDALINIKGLNEFDSVLETFRTLSPEQIEAVIKVVGANDLEDAVTRVQQLRSAAILVAEPLAAAAQKFSKLSIDAQAGFVSALNVSQTKVRELQQDIEDGVTVGTTRFKQLEAQVLRTAEAIDRLGEAEALVSQVGNGRSFQFERPLDREALIKAGESRNAALKLPGQALADNPEIATLQNRINGLANQYPRLQANLEAAKEAGADYSQQIAAIDRWRAHLLRLIADQEKQIEVSASQGQATALPRFRGESSFIGDRIAAQRASQEEAMFADRASEVAAANAAAARQRRLQRQTFGDAIVEAPRQQQSRFFGGDRTPVPSLESALARTAELDAAYARLSQTARASLSRQASELDGIARAASTGAASVGVLAEANNRMAASIAAVTAATERDAAAERARQALRMRSIAEDDRLITQERALAEERRNAAERFAGSRRSAVTGAAAMLAGRVSRQDSMESVFSGILGRAQSARVAVANASATGDYDDLRQRLASVLAELQAVESEERRLAAIDPAREQIDSWVALDNAIRNAYDRLGAITGMANRARQAAQDATVPPATPPVPPVVPGGLIGFMDVERLRANAQARAVDQAEQRRRQRESEIAVPLESLQASAEALPGARMGNAVGEFGPRLPPGFGGASDAGLGLDIDDPQRQMAALRSSTAALKNQVSQLSLPLREQMIPAIRAAEQEMLRLAANSDTTGDQIEQAAANLRNLEATARRLSAVDAFGRAFGSMDEFLGNARVRQFTGEMTALREVIAGSGDTQARRRAVAAYDRLVAVRRDQLQLDEDARRGTVAPGRQAALDRRARLAERAVDFEAAAASGMSVSAVQRRRTRGGDVGRMGADNASLALNQLAFAVDDFMSSTGGIEFKLRAISNNITQMAFVLGGTTGLFVGLGAVMAGQVAVGLIKWINNGRTAEDQTKALNDALARQKGLIEELAQAFLSLGDSISRGTMSASGETGAAFGKEVAGIRRRQQEVRENRIADLDPRVIRDRAERNKLEKQLGEETDPGARAVLQGKIRELEAADKRSRSAATAGPVSLGGAEFETRGLTGIVERTRRMIGSSLAVRPRGTGAIGTPDDVREALFNEALRNIPNRNGRGGRELSQQEREDRARAIANRSGDTRGSQRDAIESMIAQLRPASEERFLGVRTAPAATAEETIARLTSLLEQLESPFQKAIDNLSLRVAAASEDAARSIRSAQEDVAAAIGRGVPGAAALQRELDSLASDLSGANANLARATEMSASGTDPAKREAAILDAQRQVEDVRAREAETESRAREVRLGRTMGGERTSSALSAVEGSERFKNERAGLIARARETIDSEMQAVRASDRQRSAVADRRQQLQEARADLRMVQVAGGDTTQSQDAVRRAEADLRAAEAASKAADGSLEWARAASEATAAILEASVALEESLSRIRKVGDSALQRSEQGADAAQKAFEETPLRAGSGQSRDDAERRLINDRARVAQAQVGLDIRRGVVQNDPRMQGINKELEAITQRRADLEAKARTGSLDPAEQKELDSARKREIELMRQREHLARDLTEAERKQLDAINNGIAARERELEKSRQRAAEDPTFKRRMDATNQLIADSERQANEARERFINNPTAKNQKERDEAEENLRRDRQRAQELQDELDNARREMESDPRIAGNNRAIAENDKRLAELAEKEASGGLTQDEKDERRRLQGENRSMRRDNEDMIASGTEYEQDAIDAQQQGIRDRDRALRGRDLGMTDRERFRRDFAEGAGADINARAAELRGQGVSPAGFLRQALKNQMEQVAPMLQQFQEERQNALLQGPSRAALNVSDVSTSQGQSELNRLLRGDDSAKDVNLAELSKQTGKLQEIIDQLKVNNPEVLL